MTTEATDTYLFEQFDKHKGYNADKKLYFITRMSLYKIGQDANLSQNQKQDLEVKANEFINRLNEYAHANRPS